MDSIRMYHCPFQQLASKAGIRPGSVSLVATDPFYDRSFLPQADAFARLAAHLLRDGGLLVVRYGDYWFDEFYTTIRRYLQPGRCKLTEVWDGEGNVNYPRQSVSKTCQHLVFSKGNWQTRRKWIDVVRGRKDKDLHPHQQPVEVADYIVSYFSDPGDIVVDPCAGSFTYAAACYRLGRRFIGCDLAESNVRKGFSRIEQERATRVEALAVLEGLLRQGAAPTRRSIAKTWENVSTLPKSSFTFHVGLLPPASQALWQALPESRGRSLGGGGTSTTAYSQTPPTSTT